MLYAFYIQGMVSRRVRTNDELMQMFDLYNVTMNNVLFRMQTELREQGKNTVTQYVIVYILLYSLINLNVYSDVEVRRSALDIIGIN